MIAVKIIDWSQTASVKNPDSYHLPCNKLLMSLHFSLHICDLYIIISISQSSQYGYNAT